MEKNLDNSGEVAVTNSGEVSMEGRRTEQSRDNGHSLDGGEPSQNRGEHSQNGGDHSQDSGEHSLDGVAHSTDCVAHSQDGGEHSQDSGARSENDGDRSLDAVEQSPEDDDQSEEYEEQCFDDFIELTSEQMTNFLQPNVDSISSHNDQIVGNIGSSHLDIEVDISREVTREIDFDYKTESDISTDVQYDDLSAFQDDPCKHVNKEDEDRSESTDRADEMTSEDEVEVWSDTIMYYDENGVVVTNEEINNLKDMETEEENAGENDEKDKDGVPRQTDPHDGQANIEDRDEGTANEDSIIEATIVELNKGEISNKVDDVEVEMNIVVIENPIELNEQDPLKDEGDMDADTEEVITETYVLSTNRTEQDIVISDNNQQSISNLEQFNKPLDTNVSDEIVLVASTCNTTVDAETKDIQSDDMNPQLNDTDQSREIPNEVNMTISVEMNTDFVNIKENQLPDEASDSDASTDSTVTEREEVYSDAKGKAGEDEDETPVISVTDEIVIMMDYETDITECKNNDTCIEDPLDAVQKDQTILSDENIDLDLILDKNMKVLEYASDDDILTKDAEVDEGEVYFDSKDVKSDRYTSLVDDQQSNMEQLQMSSPSAAKYHETVMLNSDPSNVKQGEDKNSDYQGSVDENRKPIIEIKSSNKIQEDFENLVSSLDDEATNSLPVTTGINDNQINVCQPNLGDGNESQEIGINNINAAAVRPNVIKEEDILFSELLNNNNVDTYSDENLCTLKTHVKLNNSYQDVVLSGKNAEDGDMHKGMYIEDSFSVSKNEPEDELKPKFRNANVKSHGYSFDKHHDGIAANTVDMQSELINNSVTVTNDDDQDDNLVEALAVVSQLSKEKWNVALHPVLPTNSSTNSPQSGDNTSVHDDREPITEQASPYISNLVSCRENLGTKNETDDNSKDKQMAFKIRTSKFRHVFGSVSKKDQCYENVKITKNAHDSIFCAVNPKFLAVVTECAGGGSFLVIPLSMTGRVDVNSPKVCGHAAPVLDIKWCPFDDHLIASASDDATVKLWKIPKGGLTENLTDWLVDLHGHQRRVAYLDWHPTAKDIILSASYDHKCILWNVEQAEPINVISCHNDSIFSIAWNRDGSLFSTTSKDKRLRVIDPRSGEVIAESTCHLGPKASKCIFIGDTHRIYTTGFSRISEREYAIWDVRHMNRPMKADTIDFSSGVLMPYYDPDTRIVFLAGKGDGNIRYYEMVDDAPYCHFLSQFQSALPQRGLGVLPKIGCDTSKCEIMRFYKLHTTKNLIEPISMIVPRKAAHFQDDIFVPTASSIPSLSADEWMSGQNRDPILVSMLDGQVTNHPAHTTSRAVQRQDGGALSQAPQITTYKALSKSTSAIQEISPSRHPQKKPGDAKRPDSQPQSLKNIKRLSSSEDPISESPVFGAKSNQSPAYSRGYSPFSYKSPKLTNGVNESESTLPEPQMAIVESSDTNHMSKVDDTVDSNTNLVSKRSVVTLVLNSPVPQPEKHKIHIKKVWSSPPPTSPDVQWSEELPQNDVELRKSYFKQQDEIRQLQDVITLKDKRIKQLEEELRLVRGSSCGPGESNC